MLDHVDQVGYLREERIIVTKAVCLLIIITRAANIKGWDVVGVDKPVQEISICTGLT